MNIWETLEIEPTVNKEEIKKAFYRKTNKISDKNSQEFKDLLKIYSLLIKKIDAPKKENSEDKNNNKEHNKVESSKDKPNKLKITELEISKKFKEIITIEYWNNYYDKLDQSIGIVYDNLIKNLEKFVYYNYQAIPRETLEFIIKKFNLFKNKSEIKDEILNTPNYMIYNIDDFSFEENLKFYNLRYEIFFQLNNGYKDIKNLEILFNKAEKLNPKDKDLKLLKVTVGLLDDIEKSKANPLDLKNTLEIFKQVEKIEDDIYTFYEKILEGNSLEDFSKIDESIFELNTKDYVPEYLNIFLKGFVEYSKSEYDLAYSIWFENKLDLIPTNLKNISKNLIIDKYEYLSKDLKKILVKKDYIKGNFTIEEIISDQELYSNIENWENSLKYLKDSELDMENILNFLKEKYIVIPKAVIDYLYNTMEINSVDESLISKELKDEMKNIPNFNFNNNIPENQKEDFFRKRYEYFILSTDENNQDLANIIYGELKKYGFDYSVETIRVQQLFFSELKSNVLGKDRFVETEKKIEELAYLIPTKTIELYEIFLKAYKNENITEEEVNKVKSMSKDSLIISSDIYNFMIYFIYKIANKKEEALYIRELQANIFIEELEKTSLKTEEKESSTILSKIKNIFNKN
ncbi:hypothetical protein [Miniphocaeibacter halophilus]|uniref:Uncharacterized protein n=1 Tax=Miniphocaeibacter halophilus TaxID=2931922 RepID=A0AC61MVA4_9FIRM|nr:hypothetical protein [Miniphocaeibacter halophilus]QQK08340.1 hypothetical protein JFY71_02005 [Miniphocaeibacter halophilus]